MLQRSWQCDYVPQIAADDAERFPALDALLDWLGGGVVETVPVPSDCRDLRLGFVPSGVPSRLPSIGFGFVAPRRGAGVVERGSLENCWRRKALVGSNPTPSAL